jgi:hypothetical protein
MPNEQPVNLVVQIGMQDADAAELDQLRRQLVNELLEQDVESAGLLKAGAAPEGTKSAEAITIGSVAISVLPAILPKIVEAVQAWALRGQGRVVKFKGKVGGTDVEFEGGSEDLKTLLGALGSAGTTPQA